MGPQPFFPLLAPSPLMPFTYNSVPKLSGLCTLKFSAAENVLTTAATDCWASFAPYLANVVCCPQFDATLAILLGQSSKYSGELALNSTQAEHCLSDVEQILQAQGAVEELHKLCSISPLNLTKSSCPLVEVNEIERLVDSSRLLDACGKINVVSECCNRVCQNAISDAARIISLKGNSSLRVPSTTIDDCKSIVLRWLASKLDPSSMNSVLRGLSSCNINKVCPLDLPDMKNVTKECGNAISNQTACCNDVESYVSHLQEQSLITTLQALNCAALLGTKLQIANVSHNVYNLCQINLKDFSLQDSGCLLPSLPMDATYDKSYGISFVCDLNDNVAAPWPSSSFLPASSCTSLPAIPKAPSAQTGLDVNESMFTLLIALIFLGLLI
ncbi:putative GPI-anchored protein [Actinidia chinensis var. chinensis]|uniref:Putative GPI-anchored protein n=1 Tax=Actinidia chinensis var. chinensis TaxID=1590841 RepID=A0A2R6QTH5_ACTCC|nr:putative GPI-anchored protein [Actinidia chinensis var. chinensis]